MAGEISLMCDFLTLGWFEISPGPRYRIDRRIGERPFAFCLLTLKRVHESGDWVLVPEERWLCRGH